MENCEDSLLNKSLEEQAAGRVIRIPVAKSKYINCDLSYEEYQEKLAGRFKKNNRRKRRKAESLGKLEFDILNTQQDFNKQYEAFLDLESSGWKGEKGKSTAIKQHEELRQFYANAKSMVTGEAEVIINSLSLDGKCIAAQYSVIVAGTVHLLKIAFDEEYSEISPGFLLLDELIKVVCEQGSLDRISFVTGASWNDDWQPETLAVYELIIANRTIKGSLVLLAYRAKAVLKKILQQAKPGTSNG
jgi:CelD/BcsL family acetyltransferase involved in cellulose biosynthesis